MRPRGRWSGALRPSRSGAGLVELRLNDGETEVIGLGTRCRLQHLTGDQRHDLKPLNSGSEHVIRRVTSSCFFQLRRLRQIRKHNVNRQVVKQAVGARFCRRQTGLL